MFTRRPPADDVSALREEIRELRAALTNIGELLTEIAPEIRGLRRDLNHARVAQLALEGRAINTDARIEAIEAQLGL